MFHVLHGTVLTSPVDLCYNPFVPSKQWIANREQIVFWLKHEEARELRRACAEQGLSVSAALRRTVRAVLGIQEEPEVSA